MWCAGSAGCVPRGGGSRATPADLVRTYLFAMTGTELSPAGGWWSRLSIAAADIKLAHSIFAMPFAVLAAFLARDPQAGWARFGVQITLIVVCMVAARTFAMLVNRYADRSIDAQNPRTARRAIASGRLAVASARAMIAASALAFIGACGLFWLATDNPWPLALSVPVLAWVAFYSFTKRFTALCHFVLGVSLAIAPIAAAIAIDPRAVGLPPALGFDVQAAALPAVWWLALMVVLWVAGFDVIYALQDQEFDAREGLRSIPAKLGTRGAIWLSRLMHAGAAGVLLLVWRSDARLGPVFLAGVALVWALLVLEHVILARRGKAGLDMAFFTVNGVVSCVLGVAGVADTLL
jgi:4-hydroxybenzoate polyprenyltransferase